VNHNEARVPRGDIGDLGPVPPVAGSTQDKMKVRSDEFLLEKRLASIMFDLGVRETIPSLRADP
jgi:hypothetical protein